MSSIFKKGVLFFALATSASWSHAQADLFYYLSDDITYDKKVPTPESVIDHEIGEWHITHDKLVYYFYELASVSSRVTVQKYGVTYESRPLLNVVITSEENQRKLEQIRLEHLKLSDPKASDDVDMRKMPVIIRLGYSVHGNEASGCNASVLVAYHLAAAQGKEIEDLLDDCVILIDPVLNPDGLQRFSTWANQHKSKNLNADPNSREFKEAWPNGRTNHYWFDLNRDWLLAQQPETIGRLKLFHDWRPNIQTDHHEMESDATFFFQPGIPSRKHPLIPEENVVLTEKIGNYHAKALDKYKRLYYTKESFDDFYFGKGSTYPDIHGSIGILFEQAAVRGHLRNTENGAMSFPFAIKNQFITSLSTIDAAKDLRLELLNFQRDFYQKDANKNKGENRALIVGAKKDQARVALLGQALLRHGIEMYRPSKDIEFHDRSFPASTSLIFPLDQLQQRLIKAIFERRTQFSDSLFYDVSAWDFDLAYNMDLQWFQRENLSDVMGERVTEIELPQGGITGKSGVAYVIEWDQYFAPALVYGLQSNGLILKVANESFTSGSGKYFTRGSILIPVGIQEMGEHQIVEVIEKYALTYHVRVFSIDSGLALSGIDLGSNNFNTIRKPRIVMPVGKGVSSYEAGEVWHLLDQRFDIPLTMPPSNILGQIKLDGYNVMVLPDGSHSSLNAAAQEQIKRWVKNGGTLIAWRDALKFVAKLQIADLKFKRPARDTIRTVPYALRSRMRGAQVIGGAIFNMKIDNTHPLAYGYKQNSIPVFKRGTLFLEPGKRSVSNPFTYTIDPLLSGYVSRENLEMISGSPAVSISTFGSGKVIAFTDNHNFRAFWYGTNRLFLNSIFFGDQISTR